jgi:NAD-dependent deacetylase sirtuin 5
MSPSIAEDSTKPVVSNPAITRDFKDELRRQLFARDQREKPSLDKLVPSSSAASDRLSFVNLAFPTDFPEYLASSERIICLVGAGLSVSSGIATFRDANGKDRFWRDYQVSVLSAVRHFKEDPILSWWYYVSRRQEALRAAPNAGHEALAQLAGEKDTFVVSQNIDGLLERTSIPEEKLISLHGSIFSLRCSNDICEYKEDSNHKEPLVPALAIPSAVDISLPSVPLPEISKKDLPQCPICNNFLRPGILWFGEEIAKTNIVQTNKFLNEAKNVDLMLVIGTSAMVWPAAEFIHKARKKGAKVAVFDMKKPIGSDVLMDGDWFFEGDAAITLPKM